MISSPSSKKRRSSPDCSWMACDPPREVNEEAAETLLVWARERARTKKVPWLQVAAVARVMGNELRDRPVHVSRAAQGKPVGSHGLLPEHGRHEQDLELNVEGAFPLVVFVEKVRQRFRIAFRTLLLRNAERRQRLGRDHPR